MKVREKRSVYFDGSFWGHSGRDHAGREISINKRFRWADRDWLIPAMYICGKGLVVEFCMQIDPKQIMAFMDKWSLNMETDSYRNFSREQQMEIDGENPLHFDFQPKVLLNGKELVTSHGCGVSYNPCLPEDIINELEAKQVMDYCGLDDSRGWMIWRSAFPWKTKRRPEIRTISVTMEQRMAAVPGMHFCVSAVGDSIEFCHPATGVKHTIHVKGYEQQEMQKNGFPGIPDKEFPVYYTAMSYTVTPQLPEGTFALQDCAESDSPRTIIHASVEPEADSSSKVCVGIIGGADGPTEIVVGKQEDGKQRTAYSALHFEPAEAVEWRMVFYERQYEELTVELV